MGSLTAAAGQRCEQVKVPPQARGSQWKTRGLRKYKSDVFAVKFPAQPLVWASPWCLMCGCCSAGPLCWQQWTALHASERAGLNYALTCLPQNWHHLDHHLNVIFFLHSISHDLPACVCDLERGDVCERWWGLAQVFCISSATDRTFI